MNPEDFWSDAYENADFEDDCNRVQDLLTFWSRKSVKYFSTEVVIDYSAPDVETILLTK